MSKEQHRTKRIPVTRVTDMTTCGWLPDQAPRVGCPSPPIPEPAHQASLDPKRPKRSKNTTKFLGEQGSH